MNQTRRIERLDRVADWRDVVGQGDRILAWAVATGRCDEAKAATIRERAIKRVPLAAYVTGCWEATPPSPEVDSMTDAMLAAANQWEVEQGLQPPRPPISRD